MSNNDYPSAARLSVLRGGLPAFIAVSVVLHGLLLGWQAARLTPPQAEVERRIISVRLGGEINQPAAAIHTPAPAHTQRAQAAADAATASLEIAASGVEPDDISRTAGPVAAGTRMTVDDTLPATMPNINQTTAVAPAPPAATTAPETVMADAPVQNSVSQGLADTRGELIAEQQDSRQHGQPSAATTPVAPPSHAAGDAPPAQAATTADAPDARAALLSQIKQLVMSNLDYPLRARRQGWQGEVLLDFRVGETGALDRIQLVQSSGHVLLDRSALRALGLVQRVTLPADHPAGLVLQLQLPVIFRLQEG